MDNIDALDRYRFAGHSYIVGKSINGWQTIDEVLAHFGAKRSIARKSYRQFLVQGISLGRQPKLVGGGLVRSAGGWSAVRSLCKAGIFQKSDERILGDGNFVDSVLASAQEATNKRYKLAAKGVGLDALIPVAADLLSVDCESLIGSSKERIVVKARAVLCFWAVYELGISMTGVADYLKISVPTVSVAAKKGRKIVRGEGLDLAEILNIKI